MDLTARLENLLEREIAWLQDSLAWYENLDDAMNAEQYEILVVEVNQQGKAIDNFSREREILEKEMRANGVTNLPESLKPLAGRTAELAHALQTAQTKAAERTAEAAAHIKEELGNLQRGRDVLDGYRSGGGNDAKWLDSKG